MNIYEGLDNISTKFPIDTSLGFTDIVKYDNYSFKEFDNSLVSTNNGVGNSISHSYLKLDLSKYDSNDRFLLEIDDFASHGDSGKIIMTNEKEVPRYYNFLAYNSFKNILISSNSGNNVAKTNSEIIHGGEIYYLHLMYIKNETKDYYDDIYRIDGVRIYKIVSNEEKLLDFSKDKYQFKNYSFVKEDNKYVSSNSEPYTSSYSYFELDLTNYSSNRKFILDIEANLEIINNGSGFAKIYISPSDSIPWFYYNTGGADKITRYSITTSSNNYSTELTGGQKYYVHFSSTNYNGKIKTTISSIELKEIVSTGNNYYCYYDSDEEKVEGIFANLSTKVISSVPKLTAKSAKIKLSTVKNENVVFHIEDFDGNRTEYIEENINLTNESFELNDKYRFVLDKVSGCNEEKCTLQLKLFNVEIELVYDDDKVKIISLDDEMIPLVTIEYENGKAIN